MFEEKASGCRGDRPGLQLLRQLGKRDLLVVWKLDRLSRSGRDVLMIMARLVPIGPLLPADVSIVSSVLLEEPLA